MVSYILMIAVSFIALGFIVLGARLAALKVLASR
jgi:hypothetical protein